MKIGYFLLVIALITSCTKEEESKNTKKEQTTEKRAQAITDKTIRFATVNWPPFYSENLRNGGPYTEITRQAFEKVGYKYSIDFIPWQRALLHAEKGIKYHGLQGAWMNEERQKTFHYSNIVYPSGIFFISKKGRKFDFKNLDSLVNYKIGINRGYAYYKEFKENKNLTKVIVDAPIQTLKMILNGRIDLTLDNKLVLLSTIKENMPEKRDEFEIHEPSVSQQPLYNTISKKIPNSEQIISDFNKGLELLKKEGGIDKILKSHGLK
ncbi:MAG: transporter substrate-binding domain-containing protein [Bdellovibrionales bacterium]|jgi:polar amino acid transport system substrate-binding protein|nr:transporter substrate-binding domain-containing protein [Bdellovibrionales bacterium]